MKISLCRSSRCKVYVSYKGEGRTVHSTEEIYCVAQYKFQDVSRNILAAPEISLHCLPLSYTKNYHILPIVSVMIKITKLEKLVFLQRTQKLKKISNIFFPYSRAQSTASMKLNRCKKKPHPLISAASFYFCETKSFNLGNRGKTKRCEK